MLLATLTAVVACGTPRQRHEAIVTTLDRGITATRDSVPHAGPRYADLPDALKREASEADDPETFRRAMARLLDGLHDGHAKVRPMPGERLDAPESCALAAVDGALWVRSPHLPQAGRAQGSEPTSRLPWHRLERIDGHAPRSLAAAVALMEGPPDTTVEIGFLGGEGSGRVATLQRVAGCTIDRYFQGVADAAFDELARSEGTIPPDAFGTGDAIDSLVRAAWIRPGVGYVRLGKMDSRERCTKRGCFDGDDPCADRLAIAAAIEPLLGAEVIVLDLAGNGGGTCRHGAAVTHRLLPRTMERVPFVHTGDTTRWPVAPQEERFGGRLVVVADEDTASAAEHLVNIFKGEPGVTVVGTRTSGSEFSLCEMNLPADRIAITFGARPTEWDPPRRSTEGRPVEPDIVTPLPTDRFEDHDLLLVMMERRWDMLRDAWTAAGVPRPKKSGVLQAISASTRRAWPISGWVQGHGIWGPAVVMGTLALLATLLAAITGVGSRDRAAR